jgi:hypothetical protein
MAVNIEVMNPDIRGLCERIDRVRYEVLKSGSANIDDIRQAVRARITEYNTGLRTYCNVMFAEPEQDYPKSYPMTYPVRITVTDDMEDVENLEIRDLDTLYKKVLIEMSNSSSARRESGMKVDDKERFDAYMTRIEDFLTKFVDEVNPQDFVESMPSVDTITSGKLGI